MASWMIHLRVADAVGRGLGIEPRDRFILGNIAPDSGVPSEDWSTFTPGAEVSHFRTVGSTGLKQVGVERYLDTYMTGDQMNGYTDDERAFHLGYLSHLLTDRFWSDRIAADARERDLELFENDRIAFWRKVKADGYDLDFIYLKRHPEFEAYAIYRSMNDIRNRYLDFFAEDAFDLARTRIVGFYNNGVAGVNERPCCLTTEELDSFVSSAAEEITEFFTERMLA